MELNREKVLQNYSQVEEAAKSLAKSIKKDFKYKTGDRYLTGFAVICEVEDRKELVEIYSYLKKQMKDDTEAATELGIDPEDLVDEDEEVPTICGYPVEDWLEDVKTRKAQLDAIDRLANLEKAKNILKRNLSDDDLFNLEMSEVADLVK